MDCAHCVGYGCFWLVYISYVFFCCCCFILLLLLLFLPLAFVVSFLLYIWMKTAQQSLDYFNRERFFKGCCAWWKEEVLLIVVSIRQDKFFLMEAHREANAWVLTRFQFYFWLEIFKLMLTPHGIISHRKNEFLRRVFNFKVKYYESAKTIYQIRNGISTNNNIIIIFISIILAFGSGASVENSIHILYNRSITFLVCISSISTSNPNIKLLDCLDVNTLNGQNAWFCLNASTFLIWFIG